MIKTSLEFFKRNLEDAGLSKKEVESFLNLNGDNLKKLQCDYLDNKRQNVLDKIHKEEKQISCIDYLKCIIQRD